MKSHKTASDWWDKDMGNNCVPITVGLENLMNEEEVKYLRLRKEKQFSLSVHLIGRIEHKVTQLRF